jgi:predicted secreted protein
LAGGKGGFGAQNMKLAVIDHSAQLHQDFEQFLFKDTLSDLKIVVRQGFGAFDGVAIGD